MIKFANPFYYPVAVFVGGVILVAGVRLLKLPNMVILPAAVAVTTLVSAGLKSQEPTEEELAQQLLKQELQAIKSTAKILADKSQVLHQEAQQLLKSNSWQMDLLVAVQHACDRATQLPIKIEQLADKLPKTQSLLSVRELEQQLEEVNTKIAANSGIARDNFLKLADSLARNIDLARTGQDTLQAQILNLKILLQESAGLLQQLQNKLRNADLERGDDVLEIQTLSNELNNLQTNVDYYLD